jgi:hypothetical protein
MGATGNAGKGNQGIPCASITWIRFNGSFTLARETLSRGCRGLQQPVGSPPSSNKLSPGAGSVKRMEFVLGPRRGFASKWRRHESHPPAA